MKRRARIRFHDAMMARRLEEFIQYVEIRRLADDVVMLQRQKGFRTLAILSFMPGEGKTLACAALALAFAEFYRLQVLIVDTTTQQHAESLSLKSCFDGSAAHGRFLSHDDLPVGPDTLPAVPTDAPLVDVVLDPRAILNVTQDTSIVTNTGDAAVEDIIKQHMDRCDLVMFDTAPLNAPSKHGIDPLRIARQSDVSILVVSKKFLQAPNRQASLRMLEDPSLHIIGMIANEEFLK